MKTTTWVVSGLAVAMALLISCEESFHAETLSSQTEEMPAFPEYSPILVTNYTLSGQEGDAIPLKTAKAWTANFRQNNPSGTRAHFFGNEILRQILAEEGCVGIRMYYALDDKGNRQIILLGVNSKGEDLLPSTMDLTMGDQHVAADASWPCPSFCDPREF